MVSSLFCIFTSHMLSQNMSSFFSPNPQPHPLLIQFSSSLFLAHAMPPKAIVYRDWGTVFSTKMGSGLASHPISVPIPFSTGVDAKPYQNLAGALHLFFGAQKFYPLAVWKRNSCYNLPAERFCLWNRLQGLFRQKGGFLKKFWEDKTQKTCHSFALPCNWEQIIRDA